MIKLAIMNIGKNLNKDIFSYEYSLEKIYI